MTQYFEQEYAKETQRRMEFNDQNYRYLPSNLKFLLEDPPIKFSIFPKHLLVDNLKESQATPKQMEVTQDKINEFLEDWAKQHGQLQMSKHLADLEDLRQSNEASSTRPRLISGSVVDEDYMSIRESPGQSRA